ncbi:MAG: serine/threonine-protein kinase, partial [Acidobacteriota bacterium]
RRQNELLEAKIIQRTTIIEEQKQDLAKQKEELARKNQELEHKNIELLESNQRADRIFSALAEALPGAVLDGKYQLGEKIGSGGFGAVYHGTHLTLKRPIAVKIFKPMPGNDSAKGLERFRLEAIAASRIDHPNVVAVLDSGISSEGIAYIVMELLKGHSLAKELQVKGVLTISRLVEILLPICDVLAKAHELDLVHRDIKPENIFLHQTEQGEIVKVVDFGIAKFAEERGKVDIKGLTSTNNLIGTPAYMAPERIQYQIYDGRADIYSLGIMIYQMLSGQLPFIATEGNMVAVLIQHVCEIPPSLRTLNQAVPEDLAELVMRMLAKQPEERPTARELGRWLTKLTTLLPKDRRSVANDYKTEDITDEQELETLKFEPTLYNTEPNINKKNS